MNEKGLASWAIGVIIVIVIVIAGVGAWYGLSGEETTPEKTSLNVAAIMWGHHDEGMWDTSSARALDALKEKYDLNITYMEGTTLDTAPDVASTAADMNDVVLFTSSEYEEAMREVASDYPDTVFVVEYEAGRVDPADYPANSCIINFYPAYKLAFLGGVAAANVSETGKIGIINAIPGKRDITLFAAPFREGVHYVNPDIQVDRVVIGAYADPMKSRDTVKSYAESGYDVVYAVMDTEAATQEAERQGIYSMQEYSDIVSEHPDTVIGCLVWRWQEKLDMIFESVANGEFDDFRDSNFEMLLALEDKSLDIPTWGNIVSEDTKQYVAEVRQKIIDGEIEVPIIEEW